MSLNFTTAKVAMAMGTVHITAGTTPHSAPSFDAYANFKERARAFRRALAELETA